MSYTPPGVTLTEMPTPSTVSLADTQRLPIYIGKGLEYKVYTNEPVIKSSTGSSDTLTYSSTGIIEIVRVGSQINLEDYKETTDYVLYNDEILWTSTGSHPAAGTTYYVTNKYNRPTSDYTLFKTFNDINTFVNDIGYINSDNDLGKAAYMSLKLMSMPLIGVVQVAPPYSSVDFQDAIDKTKEINHLVSLYVLSTDYTVQSYIKNHVIERSLPQNKREREGYLGAAIGTIPGDKTNPNSISGLAYDLSAEEVVFVSPARCQFTFRNSETNLIETTTEDGSFLASVVGTYKDSIPDPSAPILRHDLSRFNLSLFDADRDIYFAESVMNTMASAGVLVVYPKGNKVVIRDDITTDTSDIRKSSLNVIIAKHYITRYIRNDLDNTFIGNKIINRVQYAQSVKGRLVRIFSLLKGEGIIENFDIGDLKAKVSSTEPAVVLINYAYIPIFTNKRIEGEYYLKTA